MKVGQPSSFYFLRHFMEIVAKTKIAKTLLWVSTLTFFSFVLYVLYINQDVLYTAQDRSEFLRGTPFFDTLMSKPFGLMQYVGAWLTQLFYYPLLGAGVLVAIWALVFYVGSKAFRLQDGAVALLLLPIACLLTSVVDLGYWIYLFTIRGYWFSQSVAYLLTLLLLWVARCTPRQWHLCWYLIGVCLYPILGWYAMLFVLCLVLVEKPTWRELIGVILLIFTANIWRALLYTNLKLSQVMLAGLPRFETPSDTSVYLTIPFWALGGISLLIPLCKKYIDRGYVPVLCTVTGILFTISFMFNDKNYINEMRMVRYASDNNWQEVLNVAEKANEPTSSMIMLKNVALMNKGNLLDQSFKMGNINTPLYNPGSLHVSFLEIASPVVYYNYGMLNESFRLSFECAVQAGFSPFYLKMLARCASANGEDNLANRYITMLHGQLFYNSWQPAAVSEKVQELHGCFPDEISGVENSDKYLVNSMSVWYQANSKAASEQSLFYAMIRRDSRLFWPSLRKYVLLHQDEEFPVHAQEAYIYYMDKAPEEKRMMLPVSQDIYDRYKQFWRELGERYQPTMSREKLASEMHTAWGDTYWYYHIFCLKTY